MVNGNQLLILPEITRPEKTEEHEELGEVEDRFLYNPRTVKCSCYLYRDTDCCQT
jgi:hypothetical protein